ncbi:TIM barrel protein [Calidifontibacter sp. DB0510]|uniref:TIM barrel protein n=1 Tax=Metallococcus carri TaxID=1656884 RepID=A0A967EHS3_9MICO|nr:TIM barrel protein [Metallococcus carri]NHN56943.1 TIM barrel protein [Metallococcus carri]NOP37688.1 TIM barrel protein [Calidifontibacter sp. DB2511S]
MTRWTVNCSILLTDRPLLERPAAAKAAGFDAVEFWWPFAGPTPASAEVDAFCAAIEQADVQLTGLNFFAGDMPAGERGVLSDPARGGEFRANLPVVVSIAERLGTRCFNALYGLVPPDADRSAAEAEAARNLRAAAEAVSAVDGTVLLEPVSGAPDYPLATAADALAVIDSLGTDRVRLLADFYHLSVNGDDVAAVIEQHAPAFGHVQIADNPGRGAPGTGNLPLSQWISRTEELGYAGPVGLEYKDESADPFAWLQRF